ncbi:MAG TPA: hypothetical protein DEG43_04300, partial [Acidimicrobiaceae bacterium]|nr:hypothetical protein [Acidimicrobiaceae bacterium]
DRWLADSRASGRDVVADPGFNLVCGEGGDGAHSPAANAEIDSPPTRGADPSVVQPDLLDDRVLADMPSSGRQRGSPKLPVRRSHSLKTDHGGRRTLHALASHRSEATFRPSQNSAFNTQ